jgi:hypothetical protein
MRRQVALACDDSNVYASAQNAGDELGELALHAANGAQIIGHDGHGASQCAP